MSNFILPDESELPHNQVEIPGLGLVTLGIVSIGVVSNAERYQKTVALEEPQRAEAFVNSVVAAVVTDPVLTPDDVARLPSDTHEALMEAIVDRWGIRDEFAQISPDVPITVRVYQAHREHFRKAIEQSIQPMLESFQAFVQSGMQQFLQQSEQLFRGIGEQFLRGFAEQFRESMEQFGETIKQWSADLEHRSEAIGEPLRQAGFWLAPSAPLILLDHLHSLVEEEQATPENIRHLITAYYEAEDFDALRVMVEDWKDLPFFAQRMHIIEPALDAHVAGQYVLSIPALLPLVEGILTDIIGRRAVRHEGMPTWARTAIEGMYMEALQAASRDIVIQFFSEITMYGRVDPIYFTPARFPEWVRMQGLTEDQVLQRHAILHGVQIHYGSKENSLRAFLLLDVLASMTRK
jgi:hypothetical protein